jgi:hypothetical protein
MDPLGVVEGRVRFPDGRPAPRATVFLGALNVTADAGGHFRFEDVKPGQYLPRAAAAPGDPKPEGEVWAATYFPSVTDRDGAESIRVATGLLAVYDVRLRSVPARHIRGIVRDEAGRPANRVTVTLNSSAIVKPQIAETDENGAFDFLALDGEWRLSAVRKDGEVERQGVTQVTVARHDVENVEIRLALPFSVPVIVEREEPPPARGGARLPTVFLTRADGPSFMRPSADVIAGIYPGRYQIHTMAIMPGEYVESIRLGDAEVYAREFDIWDGSLPIRITYKRGAPDIRGSVESGDGATVFMINADENLLIREGSRGVTAGRGGSFEFRGVRPGDYYVYAVDHSDAGIGTPGFRTAVLPRATKVHAEKGANVVLTLKIIPWPQ